MPTEASKEIELEIAYVLFIDIVGYSKLVTSEQRRSLELLNQVVREAKHFHTAEASGRLITVPTGDGMALVFYNTPEAPVECALEISSAAREHPELTPQRFRQARKATVPVVREKRGRGWMIAAALLIMAALVAGSVLLSRRSAPVASSPGASPRTRHRGESSGGLSPAAVPISYGPLPNVHFHLRSR